MTTAYDEVAYPSAVYAQTHPSVLAALAILSGMQPAPVERCRVLELGCGDGFNLIAMAFGLPESDFLGLDLAESPIARGSTAIEHLRLKNIRLEARDVATVGAEIGHFDYIIVHGLYSWVPAPVREKIMELCGQFLSPNGVAYISYNAHPGNHIRDLVRGMMRYHAAHFSDPIEQVRQARAFLRLISEAGDPKDLYRQIVICERERLLEQADDFLFHDDLSSFNSPFYFHEFMADAHRRGLQFLGEADLTDKRDRPYPAHVQAALAQLDSGDVIATEQYRDFFRGRTFRWTVLCRHGIPLNHALDSVYVPQLSVAGEIRSAADTPAAPDAAELFFGLKDSELETDRPLVKAALRRIGAVWPSFISFPVLVAQVRQDVGRDGDAEFEEDTADLADAILQAAIAGALELRAHLPLFVLTPGSHPTASALARLQIQAGPRISNLLHHVVAIESELTRHLLVLLDGTRDRTALREDLQHLIRTGQTSQPASSADSITDNELDGALHHLARLALLVA